MSTCIARLGRSVIVYDDERTRRISETLFDPSIWTDAERVPGEGGGRGAALFVSDDAGEWVLRHYHRGGLVARMLDDIYIWTGFRNSRPYLEYALLEKMRSLDLPVPTPVAARCLRLGPLYKADLITERIPGVASLAQRLIERSLAPETWLTIGGTIARFHRAGVRHADLNVHNIQVDTSQRVFLLDFDRGRIMESPGDWRRQNLERLLRSLRKEAVAQSREFYDDDWLSLLAGYEAGQMSA